MSSQRKQQLSRPRFAADVASRQVVKLQLMPFGSNGAAGASASRIEFWFVPVAPATAASVANIDSDTAIHEQGCPSQHKFF